MMLNLIPPRSPEQSAEDYAADLQAYADNFVESGVKLADWQRLAPESQAAILRAQRKHRSAMLMQFAAMLINPREVLPPLAGELEKAGVEGVSATLLRADLEGDARATATEVFKQAGEAGGGPRGPVASPSAD